MNKADRIAALCAQPSFSDAEFGELNVILERHCNTSSPKFVTQLYDQPPKGWGYPPRYIKEGNRNTDRLARDTGALLSLARAYPGDEPIAIALKLSDRLTQLKTLHCEIDRDGRIRYAANLGGTETQRHACYKSNLDTGYALHTTTESQKHLFIADDGCDLWNVDLSGADGWTIAAECAALGDTTMLDDLRAKVKPAQAVALLFEHGTVVNTWTRERIAEEAAKLDKNGWLYMACKKGIWGFCYGMGEQKQIEVIADESYKETGTPLYVEVGAIRNMRRCILDRYPGVAKRQRRIAMLLDRDGYLECANGSRREFFGDRKDGKTLGEAYAHHPQVMTTYTTSLAWKRMWYDPDNVRPDKTRIVMPLLLVHDSILFQAPTAQRAWVKVKVRNWFNNPVTIAGTTLVVPFSGGCGRTWAHASGLPGCPQEETI